MRNDYNAFGEVVRQYAVYGPKTNDPSGLTKFLTTTLDYDNAGHVTTKTAVDGITKYFYNFAGEVTRQEQQGNNSTGTHGHAHHRDCLRPTRSGGSAAAADRNGGEARRDERE